MNSPVAESKHEPPESSPYGIVRSLRFKSEANAARNLAFGSSSPMFAQRYLGDGSSSLRM